MKRVHATIGILALSAATGCSSEAPEPTGRALARATATLALLNEVLVNPPSGSDDPYEFAELRGTPGGTLDNLYLMQIEGDSSNTGTADTVINLNSACGASVCAFGNNGMLVVNQMGGHMVPPATTQIQISTGFENGTVTYALVNSATAITQGTDYDNNDDGTLELPSGAVMVDAVSWTDGGGSDLMYGPDLTASGFTPDGATRFPNDDAASSAAAWYVGDIAGSMADGLDYDAMSVSSNAPAGAKLTPGYLNFGAGMGGMGGMGGVAGAGIGGMAGTGTGGMAGTGAGGLASGGSAGMGTGGIAGAGTGGSAGSGTGGSAGSGTGGSAGSGTGGSGTGGSGTGGSGTGGSGTGGSGTGGSANPPPAAADEDDGCGCSAPGSSSSGSGALLGLALAGFVVARRRRS